MNADICGIPKCYKMPQYEEILQYDPKIFSSEVIGKQFPCCLTGFQMCLKDSFGGIRHFRKLNGPVMSIFLQNICKNMKLYKVLTEWYTNNFSYLRY